MQNNITNKNNIDVLYTRDGTYNVTLPINREPIKITCDVNFSDLSKIGMFDYNIVTGRNTWSKELREIYGFKQDEYKEIITDWSSLIHDDDIKRVQKALRDAYRTGIYKTSFRVVLPLTGKTKLIQACGTVMYDAEGNPRVLSGINAEV